MKQLLQRHLLIALGWFFVVLGVVGIILPLLPTTSFMILALALFARSSPRFHLMLLNNRWMGESLRQWESNKTVSRRIKYRASILVLASFGISIVLLHGQWALQLMLVAMAGILLFFIWRLQEQSGKNESNDET